MSASESSSGRRVRLQNLREAALHRKVLSQHLAPAFNGRWTRRHWAHARLFATLGALLAAIVPGFSPAMDASAMQASAGPSRTTLALALPSLPLAQLRGHKGDSWQLVTVQRGQTLGSLFDDLDIPAGTMHRILALPGAKDALPSPLATVDGGLVVPKATLNVVPAAPADQPSVGVTLTPVARFDGVGLVGAAGGATVPAVVNAWRFDVAIIDGTSAVVFVRETIFQK